MTKTTALRKSTRKVASRSRMSDRRNEPENQAALIHPFLRLQQCIGNQAVGRLIQAKRQISRRADGREQEADRLANQLMRMSEPRVQRACAACEASTTSCPTCEEESSRMKRKAEHRNNIREGWVSDISVASSRRRDPATHGFFEPRLGADFSHVRMHTDALAAESKRAFGVGQYGPGSDEGRRVPAHNLTHAVQQADGQQLRLQRQLGSAPAAQTVIRLGATGPMVAELQRRLNQAGADPVLEVDGVFGEHTRAAVMVFQQTHGLGADGIVGPLTWAALGGIPTNRSESFGTVTTGGEFEQATEMDGAFQETVGPGVEKFVVDPKQCFEQKDACYDCCEKLHPWWDPREWSARKSCKEDCCDSAFDECMRSGNFPCICKS